VSGAGPQTCAWTRLVGLAAVAMVSGVSGCSDPGDTGIAVWPAASEVWEEPIEDGEGTGRVFNQTDVRAACWCYRYPWHPLDDPLPVEFEVGPGLATDVTLQRRSATCSCFKAADPADELLRDWVWNELP